MTIENNGGDALDDAALFDSLAAGNEPAEAASEPVAEAPAEAPVAEAPAVAETPAATPAVAQQEAHRVPLRELLDERDKRQALERQIEELRRQVPKPEAAPAPDFWEAPQDAVQRQIAEAITPFQQAMIAQQEMFSRARAEDKYGAEAVDAAFKELAGRFERRDPSALHDRQRLMASAHPYGALVEWHKQQVALKEIGTDPIAYRQQLEERLLSDPAFVAKAVEKARASASAAPVVDLKTSRQTSLPSVSKMGAAAPIGKAVVEDDLSDEDLYEHFAAKPQRRA